MHLFLLGVSHRTAPVDLRERLDFSSRDLTAAAGAIAAKPSMSEAVVLSTCNRSELYVATTDPACAREELVSFISEYHHVSAPTFQPHLFALENSAAVAHLFRVAAGLDSLVVGEPQILGQVKDAYQTSASNRCVGPVLSNVFRWSFGVGKRVRTETALGEGAVSVSYAAVALARKIFGRLTGRRVLVVGAGEISSLTAQHLRAHGVGEIVITSRTHAHADELATVVGGLAVPWDAMTNALGAADIVITATGSQRPIISRAQLEAAQGHRRGSALFIIDIAVPRDVDPSVGEIEQVFLYNIDDLQATVRENLARRASYVGALMAWTPRRIDASVPVRIVETEDGSRRGFGRAWGGVASDFEVVRLEGGHTRLILDHGDEVAAALRRWLGGAFEAAPNEKTET